MDPKWIQILVILVFCQKMTSGTEDRVVKEGETVEIKCKLAEMLSMVIWFRVLDHSGMEFIASFSRDGTKKSPTPLSPNFSLLKMDKQILTLNSFKKARDGGVYACATIKSNELKFGEVTRLIGENKVEVTTRSPLAATSAQTLGPTTTACACHNSNRQGETGLPVFCSIIILGPLAGGCGLLLLLLIVTTLYCHRIRTRRCPHHYKKKKLRTVAPGKQMMTNRNV
ncbi:T-cell surface glycoprotein CD8 alpha chain [Scophthalmus maximus]|uniref:Ig-like domain-containing protein n=1 Tax=Scophthalmus maximus TaxID=52904 RepID=A0A8D3ACW5_SCOMX|nr:T-cell surface glycoprotein CD8 alpha chain [Scophthalmus maximus]